MLELSADQALKTANSFTFCVWPEHKAAGRQKMNVLQPCKCHISSYTKTPFPLLSFGSGRVEVNHVKSLFEWPPSSVAWLHGLIVCLTESISSHSHTHTHTSAYTCTPGSWPAKLLLLFPYLLLCNGLWAAARGDDTHHLEGVMVGKLDSPNSPLLGGKWCQ